jgi:hypothetical protein
MYRLSEKFVGDRNQPPNQSTLFLLYGRTLRIASSGYCRGSSQKSSLALPETRVNNLLFSITDRGCSVSVQKMH